jgi:putative DNA primase/helicase
MQKFSYAVTARKLLKLQHSSDEALSIKRNSNPSFELRGYDGGF